MSDEVTGEVELLKAALAGSRGAFGVIIERYQALVCGITYSATGKVAESEELAQETFVRAWNQLHQLRDPGKFRVWLCTIARNLARKFIIKQRCDMGAGAKSLEDAGQIESTEPGPVEAAIGREEEAVVWGALQRMPERFREPIVLFYRQQRSISQVAEGLGLSEDAVKQ